MKTILIPRTRSVNIKMKGTVYKVLPSFFRALYSSYPKPCLSLSPFYPLQTYLHAGLLPSDFCFIPSVPRVLKNLQNLKKKLTKKCQVRVFIGQLTHLTEEVQVLPV